MQYAERTKERKLYTDEAIDDEEIEGRRLFSIEDKLNSLKYNANFVVRMKGEDFNLKYFQKNGFSYPHVFCDKTGLGMRIPSKNFQVSDVKQCVGSRRNLDVMDVTTQKGLEMSMKDWVKYFENPNRDRLLNVISLEFSHTRLENYVESPTVVRQIDWVDRAWPHHLKECQTESTNIIEKMKYPKVQKYCLMSVKGCYTDFHVDFGGTSVWYHILHGEKVFWLIPPTNENLNLYEDWVLSGKQADIFFADQVKDCERIRLHEGYTFMIPTGWIHAVYTPKDSLVFGGNFLHTYNVAKQLQIAEIEDKTHVPQKFRYPFYPEISWYVLERYIYCLTGRHHRRVNEEKSDTLKPEIPLSMVAPSQPSSPLPDDIYSPISPRSPIIARSPRTTDSLSPASARSPRHEAMSPATCTSKSPRHDIITSPLSPRVIITNLKPEKPDDVKQEQHKVKPEEGSTGTIPTPSDTEQVKAELVGSSVTVGAGDASDNLAKKLIYLTKYELEGIRTLAQWLHGLPPAKKGIPKDIIDPLMLLKDVRQMLKDHANDDQELACSGEPPLKWSESELKKLKPKPKMASSSAGKTPKQPKNPSSGVRRRRTRCKKCEACTRTDCSECHFCKDMKKFGGPGKMKQSCISRQCMAPVLPNTAVCMICGKDERIKVDSSDDTITTLMECGICWEIVHPNCLRDKYENLAEEGVVNEDLPNSWECAKCCQGGKQGQLKPRVPKGLSKQTPKRMDSSQTLLGSGEAGEGTSHNEEINIDHEESKENIDFTNERPLIKRIKTDHESREEQMTTTDDRFPIGPETHRNNHNHGDDNLLSKQTVESEGAALPPPDQKQPDDENDDDDIISSSAVSGKKRNGEKQIKNVLRPKYPKIVLEKFVVRPAPIPPPPEHVTTINNKKHPLNLSLWMKIFGYLSAVDLCSCLAVCKTWNRWAINRNLWTEIDCSRHRITQLHLIGIVRRQPQKLILHRTNVSYKQLSWLLARLPRLKHLVLSGCSWGGVAALSTPDCPYLESLNLNWVEGVRDESIRDLLTAAPTRRPAVNDNGCRLHKLLSVSVVGTDITDVSLRLIGETLTHIISLDFSYCVQITDEGVEILCKSAAGKSIEHLTLVGCKKLTATCLDHIKHCARLYHVNLKSCRNITKSHLQKFTSAHKSKGFKIVQEKILYKE
ncbi:lysine-specific demethylase 2B-like isoform X2 [Tubulanus polymorphus]|uniref:lysine-specific demethylase 2B-like isoform X2 n=1 Tax=Tubulanus polymorphus TaxID=672921 RepID=UPI003DA4F0D9